MDEEYVFNKYIGKHIHLSLKSFYFLFSQVKVNFYLLLLQVFILLISQLCST